MCPPCHLTKQCRRVQLYGISQRLIGCRLVCSERSAAGEFIKITKNRMMLRRHIVMSDPESQETYALHRVHLMVWNSYYFPLEVTNQLLSTELVAGTVGDAACTGASSNSSRTAFASAARFAAHSRQTLWSLSNA